MLRVAAIVSVVALAAAGVALAAPADAGQRFALAYGHWLNKQLSAGHAAYRTTAIGCYAMTKRQLYPCALEFVYVHGPSIGKRFCRNALISAAGELVAIKKVACPAAAA